MPPENTDDDSRGSRETDVASRRPARISLLLLTATAASLLLLVAASHVWFFHWNSSNPDVTAYWRAGESLRLGQPIHLPPPPGVSPKAFLYPPAFAAIFAPLTLLPPLSGYAAWMGLHFAFLGWLVWAGARLAAIRSPAARTRYLALLLVWLPAAVGGDFQEGQVNLLVAALVATALLQLEEKRWWAGGFLLALATHIKLLPALLLLPLLLQGRRRAVATSLVAMGALVLLPALITGPREGWVEGIRHALMLHVDFANTVLAPAVTDAKVVGDEQFYVFNNSLVAVLHRLFGDGVLFSPLPQLAGQQGPLLFALPRALLRGTGLAIGGAMFVASLLLARRTARSRSGRIASLGLALVAAELTALNFWEHHLVVLVLLLAPLAAGELVSPARRRALGLLSAAAFVSWTGLYLLDPALSAWGADTASRLLWASRTWGLPTLAVVALWGWSALALSGERELDDDIRRD